MDFAALIEMGHSTGYTFALETQGSISKPWFKFLDYLTLSPKPPSSEMQTKWDLFENCLSLAASPEAINIKLVIADKVDFDWALALQRRYPDYRYYLQPCNLQGEESTIEQGLAATRELIEYVVASGWHEATVLPQLHNLLWGNTRGV